MSALEAGWYRWAPVVGLAAFPLAYLASFALSDESVLVTSIRLAGQLFWLPLILVALLWIWWSWDQSPTRVRRSVWALPILLAAVAWLPYTLFTDALALGELLHGWSISAPLMGLVGLAIALLVLTAGWLISGLSRKSDTKNIEES